MPHDIKEPSTGVNHDVERVIDQAGWSEHLARSASGRYARPAVTRSTRIQEAGLAQVCIHGHFYQPPRENPWLQRVPRQPSAAPHADWNARITDECYRPCGQASIRDPEGRILAGLNTYARISFDAGPTLMRWLQAQAPDVHQAMVRGDRAAVARWGHGTALAQAYNHTILPLATPRDARTQVRWGLADFGWRFGRRAQGLWLPECAVDVHTLEILADEGVRFTVLAPQQIEAVRPPDGGWRAVDPSRPYRVDLPSGRSLAVFVYDGDIAQEIAFGRLLDSGDRLFERLEGAAERSQGLAHTATDGESYGHHHRHGEMALAWALYRVEQDPDVEVVPYARYLDEHPPTWQARVVSPSSWSCSHGVERWRSDCGCGTGPGGGAWRAPLRRALDGLRMRLDEAFEADLSGVLPDPWAARDAYVQVLLDPSRRDAWVAEQAGRPVDAAERLAVLEWMEAQHHGQLMYTSCGWFFEDLDRLEPVQDLMYAWRAVELAERRRPDHDWRSPLLEDLAAVRSSRPPRRTAAELVRVRVDARRFDAGRIAALHAAAESRGIDIDDPAHTVTVQGQEHVVEERATGRRTRVRVQPVQGEAGDRLQVRVEGQDPVRHDLGDVLTTFQTPALVRAAGQHLLRAARATATRQAHLRAVQAEPERRWGVPGTVRLLTTPHVDPARLREAVEALGLPLDADGRTRAPSDLPPDLALLVRDACAHELDALDRTNPTACAAFFTRAGLRWGLLDQALHNRVELLALALVTHRCDESDWDPTLGIARRVARLGARLLDVAHEAPILAAVLDRPPTEAG